MDFEAYEYHDVEIEYIRGEDAVLTIFHDQEEKERVNLHQYNSKAELHQLFQEKGFFRRTDEEIARIKEFQTKHRIEEQRYEAEKRRESQEARKKLLEERKKKREKEAQEKAAQEKAAQDDESGEKQQAQDLPKDTNERGDEF
jgi:hypothetical protein